MSALGPIFIKFGFKDQSKLYRQECSLHPSYSVHLYKGNYQGKWKLSSEQLEDAKTVTSTFGRLVRYVLFGDVTPCKRRVVTSQDVDANP